MKIVLANRDYGPAGSGWGAHMSTEGMELQQGLEAAGWQLAGVGYDGLSDVRTILDRYRPDMIFVQDVRDWLPECNISLHKGVGYQHLDAIAASGIPAFTILKDAWNWAKEQSWCASQINAAGIATYYRHDMIREVAPWTRQYSLLRIHHSVDADLIRSLLEKRQPRNKGMVSGNRAACYPLRELAYKNAATLGLWARPFPGYTNKGADTPKYLADLVHYKVHVACASKWGSAFRKIIESVACGVTPITDLPASDVLPQIDGALIRVPQDIGYADLRQVIRRAAENWREDERMHYAEQALDYYDWYTSGHRLSALLQTACSKSDILATS